MQSGSQDRGWPPRGVAAHARGSQEDVVILAVPAAPQGPGPALAGLGGLRAVSPHGWPKRHCTLRSLSLAPSNTKGQSQEQPFTQKPMAYFLTTVITAKTASEGARREETSPDRAENRGVGAEHTPRSSPLEPPGLNKRLAGRPNGLLPEASLPPVS